MTTGVIVYAVYQTHKFFPRFVPRRAHFSTQTFLSRAYEKASLRVREKDREPVESLIFFSFWRACLRRGPSGFRVCAGEPPFGHRHPPSCRPACPEMTNVTCHRHKGKLSSTPRHGNRVALAGHAVATREEKSGRFISQKGAR